MWSEACEMLARADRLHRELFRPAHSPARQPTWEPPVDILETDAIVNGAMGLVCTVQRVKVVFRDGATKTLLVRETDCLEKRGGEWQLIHQHASVPSGGEWDGKIVTEG